MENPNLSNKIKKKFQGNDSSNSCLYFLGMIGAIVHFVSTATGFGAGVIGVLKAFVWPAFLVYECFGMLT